jgi:concanavalin A-like lectin/glucanase superfamily protein
VLDGSWHHVAFVRERASGRKRIYVDGVLDVVSSAGVSTGNLSYPNGRPTSYPDSDPFLVFAAEKHGYPGTSSFPSFAGWIDEIRVWSVARSAAEIDAAKAQSVAPSTPGLALYLRLEEGSGTTLTDATGGNTATLYSGVPGNGEWSSDTPENPGTTTSTTATTVTTTTRPPGGGVDHFKCYKVRSAAAFQRRSVLLVDTFGSKNTIVLRPDTFCNPVDKNGEGITDATAHLTCYKIRDASGQAGFAPQRLSVQNQFGSSSLAAVSPRVLCVPSEEGGVPSALNLDHFKCYNTQAATPFGRRDVFLADQFESKNTTVLRPCSVCMPVDKNGEGIKDPSTSLVCYRIRDVSGQPRLSPRSVTVHNQFGDASLTALPARSLCVPSTAASAAGTFAPGLRKAPSVNLKHVGRCRLTSGPTAAAAPSATRSRAAERRRKQGTPRHLGGEF